MCGRLTLPYHEPPPTLLYEGAAYKLERTFERTLERGGVAIARVVVEGTLLGTQ